MPLYSPCCGCEPFTQIKYDSLRAPVFPSHSWRCFCWMWFADLSKQSRLHCQNFLSIWTTITQFRIKATCPSIDIHKTSPRAAEIRDRVVYYSTNIRGWNIYASCFGLAVGWNGCGTLTVQQEAGYRPTLETLRLNASNNFPYRLVNNNLRDCAFFFACLPLLHCGFRALYVTNLLGMSNTNWSSTEWLKAVEKHHQRGHTTGWNVMNFQE